MKFKKNKEPKEWTIKTQKGFAYFPTKISELETVWLERYEREVIYVGYIYVHGLTYSWFPYDKTNKTFYFNMLWRKAGPYKISPPPKGMRSSIE